MPKAAIAAFVCKPSRQIAEVLKSQTAVDTPFFGVLNGMICIERVESRLASDANI